MSYHDDFVQAFRESAPYIHYLRGKTVVIGISSQVLQGRILTSIASDLNLLAALGMRLVLVHGLAYPVQKLCEQNQHPICHHRDRCITDDTMLQFAKQACGQIQADFQAALSLGFAHSPQRTPRLRVVTGNFITAKPLGVMDGVDMGYTGQVRKLDFAAINDYLAQNAIVLLSPMGASLSGQHYQLAMSEVAQTTAIALRADKLIFLTEWDGILNKNNELISELTTEQAQAYHLYRAEQRPLLQAAVQALAHDVSRVQILSGKQNGDLLRELFTREGVGTSISQTPFMNVRMAQELDIIDIISLIRPLEEQGVLVHRSREYLFEHIHEFHVLEHDRQIYGCVMMKQFASCADVAELACLVVSPSARDGGYGDLLLQAVINQAKLNHKKRLLALSTHTSDWFVERGFQAAQIADLPSERLAEYHASGRQSKVFMMRL